MKNQIRQIIIQALRLESPKSEAITSESNLVETLDLDSIDILEIAMTLEDEFGVRMPDNAPAVYTSIDTLAGFIEKAQ